MFSFAAPNVEEQAAIANILSDMDAEIAALEQRRDKDPRHQAGHDAGTFDREGTPGMSNVLKAEKVTQRRVIELFQDQLGYSFLGDWTDRLDNSNIEEKYLTAWLKRRGHTPEQISAALYRLRSEATNSNRGLYANNEAVYSLLRYGVTVKVEAGKPSETIQLIDWDEPAANDFAIAEEVTLKGGHERRPDIVLYVNGIAIGVLELKNSRGSIGDGIRQNLSNQQPEFNAWFFSTVQFIFAGNDTGGLKYGTIGTPEKIFPQMEGG